MKMEDMAELYTGIIDNGADLQMEHFGTRVINTLRIEKGQFYVNAVKWLKQ